MPRLGPLLNPTPSTEAVLPIRNEDLFLSAGSPRWSHQSLSPGPVPILLTGAAPGFRFQSRGSPAAKLPGNCRWSFLSKVLHARADLTAIGIRHGSGRAGPVSASACGRARGTVPAHSG